MKKMKHHPDDHEGHLNPMHKASMKKDEKKIVKEVKRVAKARIGKGMKLQPVQKKVMGRGK